MGDRVREREGAPPAAAEDLPGLDAEHAPHLLEVLDEVTRGVLLELREGRRLAAAALVDEDDAVARRVEVARVHRCRASTGPAVHEERGLAQWVAVLVPGDRMQVRHGEGALSYECWLRVQPANG